MPIYREQDFTHMNEELTTLILSTATRYAQDKGLPQLDVNAMSQMSVSLSQTANEILMFGCDAWPESARADEVELSPLPFEIAPSETDPPRTAAFFTWSMASLAAALPVTLLLSHLIRGPTGIFYALGVIGISIAFGTFQGLLQSAAVSLANNFFLIHPSFSFSTPSRVEVFCFGCYALLALAVPVLIRLAPWLRKHALAIPLNSLPA